jgi:hypothetical protein
LTAEILRLDSEWNEAYRRRDRSPLSHVLADDFTGWTDLGEPITKALLMINPSGHGLKSITFIVTLLSAARRVSYECSKKIKKNMIAHGRPATFRISTFNSNASVQRFYQRRGARIDHSSREHLIHGVPEANRSVGVREANRTTCPAMTERPWIRTHLLIGQR